MGSCALSQAPSRRGLPVGLFPAASPASASLLLFTSMRRWKSGFAGTEASFLLVEEDSLLLERRLELVRLMEALLAAPVAWEVELLRWLKNAAMKPPRLVLLLLRVSPRGGLPLVPADVEVDPARELSEPWLLLWLWCVREAKMLSEKENELRCIARMGCWLLLAGGGPLGALFVGVVAVLLAPLARMLPEEVCFTSWEPELDRSTFTESLAALDTAPPPPLFCPRATASRLEEDECCDSFTGDGGWLCCWAAAAEDHTCCWSRLRPGALAFAVTGAKISLIVSRITSCVAAGT